MTAPANLHDDLTFRAAHVGASEVAALFDCSPWLTQFELWHRKNGTIDTPDFNAVIEGSPENERVWWGVKLEPVVIEAACERWGYKLLETPGRLSNGNGLGGHPDARVMCPKRGRGILEVKMADWLVAKQWGDEPPAHYLLQNLTYQGLDQAEWGDVIVLVGGNELRRFQYQFRPVIYADIEARVANFWDSVRAGKAPKPDYGRDLPTVAELYSSPEDTIIDMRRDNRMAELCQEYLDAKAAEHRATCLVDAAKAEMLEKLGTNAAALVEGFSCRVPVTAGTAERVITSEMVGQTLPGRKAHRRFYVKERT